MDSIHISPRSYRRDHADEGEIDLERRERSGLGWDGTGTGGGSQRIDEGPAASQLALDGYVCEWVWLCAVTALTACMSLSRSVYPTTDEKKMKRGASLPWKYGRLHVQYKGQ